jgi:hypothetical protein
MDRDLEDDMRACAWFMEKIKQDEYAKSIYSALCNMRWQPKEVVPILRDEYWTCSWRAAGGIVADLRTEGEDYMDFYCGGNEGFVNDEVREDLAKLGWHPSEYPD